MCLNSQKAKLHAQHCMHSLMSWCAFCSITHGTIDMIETCYVSDLPIAKKQLCRVPLVYAHTSSHCTPILSRHNSQARPALHTLMAMQMQSHVQADRWTLLSAPQSHRVTLLAMQDDMGELGLLILEKAYGRFDTGRPASLDKLQFTHVRSSMCLILAAYHQPTSSYTSSWRLLHTCKPSVMLCCMLMV